MELSYIDKIDDNEESVGAINKISDFLNSFSSNISLGNNFAGEIVSISIPHSTEVKVQHNLKVVPKYYIIVRRMSDGSFFDGVEAWTDKYITLKNPATSGLNVEMKILIMRG